MPPEVKFAATVTAAFDLRGRGTVLRLAPGFAGVVRAGDEVLVPLATGASALVRVSALEFVDSDLALVVSGLAPGDVAPNAAIRAP